MSEFFMSADTLEISYKIEGSTGQWKTTVHVYDEIEDIIAQIAGERGKPNLCAWSVDGSKCCLPLNIRFVDIYKPEQIYVFKETLTRLVKVKGGTPRKELLELKKDTTFNDVWLRDETHKGKSVTSLRVNGRPVSVLAPLVGVFGALPEPWKPVEIEVDTCDKQSEEFAVVSIVNGVFHKWQNVCLGWNDCWDTLREGLGVTAVFDENGKCVRGKADKKPKQVYALKLSNSRLKPEDFTERKLNERELTSLKLYRKFVDWDDESLKTFICYVMYWMLSGPGTKELGDKFSRDENLSFGPFIRSFRLLADGTPKQEIDLAVILETINAYVKAKNETVGNLGNICSTLLGRETPFAEVPESMVLTRCGKGMCVVQSRKLFLGTGSEGSVFLCPGEDGATIEKPNGSAAKISPDLTCPPELTVVFIDNSGTMLTQFGNRDISKIEAVKSMVNKMVDIVDNISKKDLPCRYSYVFMSDIVNGDAPRDLPDFGSVRDRLDDKRNRCRKTRIWESISKLIKKLSEEFPDQYKRILVLTDGEDKSNDQKITVLQEAHESNIIIDGIVFGNEEDTNEFACACRLTGGIAFRFVDENNEQLENFANRPGFIDFLERPRGKKASPMNFAHEELTTLSKIVNFNTNIERGSFDVSYPKTMNRISLMPAASPHIQRIVALMTTIARQEGVEEVLYWHDPHMWCVILSIPVGEHKIYWDFIVRFPLTYPHLPAEFLFRSNRYIEAHVDSQRRWKETKDPLATLKNITNTLKTVVVDIDKVTSDCNARFPVIESPFTDMELFTHCHKIQGAKPAATPEFGDKQSHISLREDKDGPIQLWHGIGCLGSEAALLENFTKV